MNANAVAKHYAILTAEERFRLILAASGRGDAAERDRLMNTGGRITLAMPDHSPYAHALSELSLLTFIELLEEAARYHDASELASDSLDTTHVREDEGEEADDAGKDPIWQRTFELACAAGFMLRTKADGWKLFCARLHVAPFLLWEGLPGLDRLRRALTLAERAAFCPEDFLRWLNAVRLPGESERTEVLLTAEGIATETEDAFRRRVQWWGG